MNSAPGVHDGAQGAAADDGAPRDGRPDQPALESITFEPAPSAWRLKAAPPDAAARAFREQLGLPTDAPIVMSGHQAGLWHCGIVAKWFALERLAQREGAAAAWLVVDTDDNEPTVINYPARRISDGRLEVRPWQAAPGAVVRPGTITGARAPIDPAPAPASGRSVEIPDLVSAGLGRAAEALRAQRGAASLAEQFARAAADLIGQATSAGAPTLALASRIGQTDLFADLVQRMLDDPGACTRAYNDAVLAHPEAQLRPLDVSERRERFELPIWRLASGGPRQPVYASELAGGAETQRGGERTPQLAPRALLLTGIMRLAGCELFIHGAGGGVYDKVTDAWFQSWLGASGAVELAPSVVASATWLLPLTDEPPPAPAVLARAEWELHAARHNPALIGDSSAQARKRDLTRAIASAPSGDTRRAELFHQMHDLLAAARAQGEPEIARLQRRADDLRQRLRDGEILLDRTWSLALFPDDRLRELRARIHEAMA